MPKKQSPPSGNAMLVKSQKQLWDWRWEEGFAALNAFKASNGHCIVPRYYVKGGYKLGQWISNQRYDRDTMPAERRQRLDAIGFVWNARESAWEEGFAALTKFKAREGHCRVPSLLIEGKFKLGQWVTVQRTYKDSMSAERKKRLDEIGFVWRVR